MPFPLACDFSLFFLYKRDCKAPYLVYAGASSSRELLSDAINALPSRSSKGLQHLDFNNSSPFKPGLELPEETRSNAAFTQLHVYFAGNSLLDSLLEAFIMNLLVQPQRRHLYTTLDPLPTLRILTLSVSPGINGTKHFLQ